jgi:hypothetical protein
MRMGSADIAGLARVGPIDAYHRSAIGAGNLSRVIRGACIYYEDFAGRRVLGSKAF